MGKFKGRPRTVKISPRSEIAEVWHIKFYMNDAAFDKKVIKRAKCLTTANSSSLHEEAQLNNEMEKYVKKMQARRVEDIVILNGCRGRMKKIWTGATEGMSTNENCLESAASKDVFNMSCLSESLPYRDVKDIKLKARKLAKQLLLFREEVKDSFRRYEVLKILNTKFREQNDKRASKGRPCRSLSYMVQEVFGDVKNVHIYSFRPMVKKGAQSSVESRRHSHSELQELCASFKDNKNTTQDSDVECELPNILSGNEGMSVTCEREHIIILKIGSRNKDETKSDNQKDVSNLQNPERLFNRDQRDDDRQRIESLRTQQLRESISLNRQLSRLKISNSKRDDLLEDMEIEESSTDQNIDKRAKVETANRRREIVEMLREQFKIYKKNEGEALRN